MRFNGKDVTFLMLLFLTTILSMAAITAFLSQHWDPTGVMDLGYGISFGLSMLILALICIMWRINAFDEVD